MKRKKFYCTVNGWDCPYFKNGECTMKNPLHDCDDFYAFWGDDTEDECYIWVDEKGNEIEG